MSFSQSVCNKEFQKSDNPIQKHQEIELYIKVIKQAGAELSQAQPSWAKTSFNWARQLPLYKKLKFKDNFALGKKLCLNIIAYLI